MGRYRKKSNSLSNLLTYSFVGLVTLIIIGLVYFYISLTMNQPEIDKQTLCSKDEQYSKHVILVDITDKYNFVQISDIKQRIADIVKNLEKGNQIKIYFLNDAVTVDNVPAINVCNPGKGDKSNYLYSNPKLLEKRWNEKFYIPLSNTISKIDVETSFNYSPIIEMIQWINIKEFKGSNHNNSLIIISDMIQNSTEYSFFKNELKKFTTSEYFNKYRTNMNGLDVKIMLVRRDNLSKYQSKDFLNFWYEYFMNQSSTISKILRIDG